MTEIAMDGQVSLFDLDSSFGKMYQGRLDREPRKEPTSKPSSRKSSGSQNQTLPMCLCLRGGGGASRDAFTRNWDAGQLLGEYTTRSFGEQPGTLMAECSFEALPSGVSASHLSQILEDSAHPKYCLSEKACLGILNRAKKRGKELPEILKKALMNQAHITYDE